MDKLTIRRFMTPAPHTIAVGTSLAEARDLMGALGIRHLPVLDAGKLIGIVSDRDVALAFELGGVDPLRVTAGAVMTPNPRALAPDSSLEWVAAEMVQRKIGAMVVVEHGQVAGIFTTIDALRALGEMLGRARRRRHKRARLGLTYGSRSGIK